MDVTVICNNKHQYAVKDVQGNVIVPFGTYGWIENFNRGYARVKSFNGNVRAITIDGQEFWETPKWGIIDMDGNIVVPLEYDEIWKLNEGYNRMVLYKDSLKPKYSSNPFDLLKTYGGKPKEGSEYFDVLDGQIYSTPFGQHPSDSDYEYDDYYDDYENEYAYYDHHYEEYAGTYAQDVEGYSDEEIDAIFDGEPDAYWNID